MKKCDLELKVYELLKAVRHDSIDKNPRHVRQREL